ncbi:amylovoran biosynthesis protein AmsF [Bdellovibrio sp. ZAP7]|uniref:amylovoran biosynthesis protein AmsF n=1 Tax=Bdellovibrio sp. ZAP7 TaxID=2231053 RepID=UPI00115AB651|nr:amylovoran biosynthesis protein AmsF [Bdellovibrio sp. ZAP7]QDK44758.1 amylovoran biosynthesis protein AmsF [Bdellovibrio sp. ZAP7]
MQRRQVLQSVGSSLVTALSLATISRTAEAAVLPPSLAQGDIGSVAELRTTKPSANGAKMTVRSYHSGLNVGGGDFIGYLSSGTDDGGTVFAGSGFYWRRVINDPNNLTVFDFGAKADGKTDALPAVRAMFDWSKANYPTLGIQFPAGTFFMSGFNFGAAEIPFFRMAGANVNFGYFAGTTLLSDGATSSLIKVNARRVELSNLVFKGQADTKPNYQGFFDNICTGGQFFRGSCLRFDKVGGASISLLDTLDCKIDQFYASACQNDVIRARWSGRAAGNWDHSTAIELSNFNLQNCKSGKVLNLPRCTQSLIYNGWIEHCTNPGDISNGQWILDAFSIEDCENPLNARWSRLNSRQINLQSGSSIDNSMQGTDPSRWLSAWEMGSSRVESFGAAFDGSLKYNFLTSRFRLSNDTGQATWFQLGNFFTPNMGDSWEIELFGQTQYGNGSDTQVLMNPVNGKTTGGRAVIHMQHKTDKLAEASWSAEGNSPVQEVRIVQRSATDTRVFVKIANWTPIVMVLMKTNGKDRFMAGQCIRFDAVMTAETPPSNSLVAPQRFSLHNGKAGIGGNEQGDLLMASRVLTASQVDTSKAKGYLSVVINGEQVAIPYFDVK